MKCSNCDGLGWLYLEDFREATMTDILGDDPDLYWHNGRNQEFFEYGLCPDCDGFGEEVDEDYAEDLAIMEYLDRYYNRKGFYRYYRVDFDARKVTMGVDFVWRGVHRRVISGLPTFNKFARMWK